MLQNVVKLERLTFLVKNASTDTFLQEVKQEKFNYLEIQ